MRMRVLFLISILLLGGLPMISAQDRGGRLALAVYNEGAALISELRSIALEAGRNTIILRDIAETTDPASISFRSRSDPAEFAVFEQSYRYKELDAGALLKPYVARTVDITVASGETYSGDLLQLRDEKAILLTGSNEIVYVSLYDIRGITFPPPALDLSPGPQLRLLLQSESAGEHEVELAYLAGGLNWTADYSVSLNADDTALDLRGLVTLSNYSGRAYRDASLKLIAGEVSRIETGAEAFVQERMMAMSAVADESAGVEEREFSEYKLYAVARPVTVEDGETKQIEFVSGADIAAKITFVFDSSPAFRGYYSPIDYHEGRGAASANVRTFLEFSTGADLPAGRVRIYKPDVDGASLLIGESAIGHTPQGEALMIGIGAAFDLTGLRTQTDFSFVSRRVARESFEIRLRNRKDDAVEIIVPERLYRWSDWQIIESSAPFVKVDKSSIEFAITVEPGAEEVLTYVVEYRFPEET